MKPKKKKKREIKLKRKIDKFTIVVGYFITFLSVIDKIDKITKSTESRSTTINQLTGTMKLDMNSEQKK